MRQMCLLFSFFFTHALVMVVTELKLLRTMLTLLVFLFSLFCLYVRCKGEAIFKRLYAVFWFLRLFHKYHGLICSACNKIYEYPCHLNSLTKDLNGLCGWQQKNLTENGTTALCILPLGAGVNCLRENKASSLSLLPFGVVLYLKYLNTISLETIIHRRQGRIRI